MTNSLQACLLPEPGHKLYSADFKQAELRVLAVMAQDSVLQAILDSGRDIHTEIAARIYKVAPEQVTKVQRSSAKAVVFGLIYGQTPYGLSQELKISEEEAKAIQDSMWLIFPAVKKFINDTHIIARRDRKVATYHGRTRDLSRDLRFDPDKALRLAVNHRVQSTAGDLMRIGLINLQKKLAPVGGTVLLTRHDEILFSVPTQVDPKLVFQMAHTAMVTENEPVFKMAIDLECGDRWGYMETVSI